MRGTGADEGVVSEGKARGLALGDERDEGLGFVDAILAESDGLIETIRAGGLKSGFLELLDRIDFGFAQAFAAGVAAL